MNMTPISNFTCAPTETAFIEFTSDTRIPEKCCFQPGKRNFSIVGDSSFSDIKSLIGHTHEVTIVIQMQIFRMTNKGNES